MYAEAIEDAIRKIRRNLETRGKEFPHIAEGNRYAWYGNNDWIEGFYTGLVWLSYEYTNDPFFRNAAVEHIDSFQERLDNNVQLEHHDIGFLYSLSAKAKWMIDRDPGARKLAIRAANKLMERWRPKGRYIQAWRQEDDPEHGGRIIIDCMMNLPLLYWAAEQTGEQHYYDTAVIHADLSRRYLVRGDDSSYHTFVFNPDNGTPIGGETAQGYGHGSTWTRGQAWGIYGFALSYRSTDRPEYLETAKRLSRYWIAHMPADHVAYWDFDAPVHADTPRDSSASAIAVCGMLELLSLMDAHDPFRQPLEQSVQSAMKSLVKIYSTVGDPEAEGLIKHGSYSVRGGTAPDDFMIWGDYFYLEALMRLERGFTGYWYESTNSKDRN